MGNTRKLTLSREKKFIGAIVEYKVYIDDDFAGVLCNGQTKTAEISCDQHYVQIIGRDANGDFRSGKYEIPADDLDYHFHVKVVSHWTTVEYVLEEDVAQAQYNREIRTRYYEAIENKNLIDEIVNEVSKAPIGTRDFSRLNQLPSKNKDTRYYVDAIYCLRDVYYKSIIDHYFKRDSFGINKIMDLLKDLETIDLISEEIKSLIKHYDYIVEQRNFINSVLTDNFVEELREIKDTPSAFPEELIVIYGDAKEKVDNNDIKGALSIILFEKYPVTYYDEVKKFLLKCALYEGESRELSDSYQLMLKVTDDIFKPRVIDTINEKIVTVKTVDTIIAETIRYSSVNAISEVNEILEQFLTLTASKYKIDESQYALLQNVFNYYQAYEQEKMVLEAMVTNCVSRTIEQEQRLEILRNIDMSKLISSSSCEEDDDSDDKFVYDYRFVGYSDKELKDYFGDLSLKNKTLNKPVVVREWNKSINVDSFKYDVDKLHNHLKATMTVNFDERYKVGFVSAAPVSAGESVYVSEYTEAILILDYEGYNWLAFYIEGEQLLKSKVTFSIYAVYMPMFDLPLDEEESIYKQNERMCNRIEVLKKQMNPKFNTYMNTIIEVIIEDIENWLNNSSSSNSIYD